MKESDIQIAVVEYLKEKQKTYKFRYFGCENCEERVIFVGEDCDDSKRRQKKK